MKRRIRRSNRRAEAPQRIRVGGRLYEKVGAEDSRQLRKKLLSEALSELSSVQDKVDKVLESGNYSKQMEDTLELLSEAYKLISDSIPRG